MATKKWYEQAELKPARESQLELERLNEMHYEPDNMSVRQSWLVYTRKNTLAKLDYEMLKSYIEATERRERLYGAADQAGSPVRPDTN